MEPIIIQNPHNSLFLTETDVMHDDIQQMSET
jgi:hypothetical protein